MIALSYVSILNICFYLSIKNINAEPLQFKIKKPHQIKPKFKNGFTLSHKPHCQLDKYFFIYKIDFVDLLAAIAQMVEQLIRNQ